MRRAGIWGFKENCGVSILLRYAQAKCRKTVCIIVMKAHKVQRTSVLRTQPLAS